MNHPHLRGPVFAEVSPTRWSLRGALWQAILAAAILCGGLLLILAFGFLLFLACCLLGVGP